MRQPLRLLAVLVCAALIATFPIKASAQSTSDHPVTQIEQAYKLFQSGRRDEAVYLYYVGQLRMRIHLTARPDLDPSGEPALAAALFHTVGTPINEWAWGDIDDLVATIDRVLAWHEANGDSFTPKARFPRAHRSIVRGLRDLRDYADENRDEIRTQRAANGLENR